MFKWLKSLFGGTKEETRTFQGSVETIILSPTGLDKRVAGYLCYLQRYKGMKPYKCCESFIETVGVIDQVYSWENVKYDYASDNLRKLAKKYRILKCKSPNSEFDEFIKSLA